MKAEQEGYKAFMKGTRFDSCPYLPDKDIIKYVAWKKGYTHAERKMNRELRDKCDKC